MNTTPRVLIKDPVFATITKKRGTAATAATKRKVKVDSEAVLLHCCYHRRGGRKGQVGWVRQATTRYNASPA